MSSHVHPIPYRDPSRHAALAVYTRLGGAVKALVNAAHTLAQHHPQCGAVADLADVIDSLPPELQIAKSQLRTWPDVLEEYPARTRMPSRHCAAHPEDDCEDGRAEQQHLRGRLRALEYDLARAQIVIDTVRSMLPHGKPGLPLKDKREAARQEALLEVRDRLLVALGETIPDDPAEADQLDDEADGDD